MKNSSNSSKRGPIPMQIHRQRMKDAGFMRREFWVHPMDEQKINLFVNKLKKMRMAIKND
tara:strand:- start:1605 stop:1784 length:180 start_codon:yes stop_codon:yes gene_type:complete